MAEKLQRDEIDWLESLLEGAFWGVLYHEGELAKAHKKHAIVKAVLFPLFPEIKEKDALSFYESADDSDEIESVEEFVRYEIGSSRESINYHEKKLAEDHLRIARISAIIKRAGLGSEISIDATAEAAKKRYEENNK